MPLHTHLHDLDWFSPGKHPKLKEDYPNMILVVISPIRLLGILGFYGLIILGEVSKYKIIHFV
jgi:hypothetical protein